MSPIAVVNTKDPLASTGKIFTGPISDNAAVQLGTLFFSVGGKKGSIVKKHFRHRFRVAIK